MTEQGDHWRALVSYMTSNRPDFVRRCLPHLARALRGDSRLELLVALDGNDRDTRAFCADWEIPLLYSDEREGVGLSKNRVLESFPDYDYYFFLEDDVEILDGSVFPLHVELMRASGIHHMALFGEHEGSQQIGETMVLGRRIVHFNYGSAEFNVFTREGLERVGGWHPAFAQFRRWGHTEHSLRFPRSGLAPAPFNVAVELADACIRHRPLSVTRWERDVSLDAHGISPFERDLISQELTYVPVQTICGYHLTGTIPGDATRVAGVLDGGHRYPLLSAAGRRDARADFHVWRSATGGSSLRNAFELMFAALLSPRSMAVRHAVKLRLGALVRRFRSAPQ